MNLKILFFVFLFCSFPPLWANLYFRMPHTGKASVGEFKLQAGLVFSEFDHPDWGREERFYVPNLYGHLQISSRFGVSIGWFGVYRSSVDLPFSQDVLDAASSPGDVTLGCLFTAVKREKYQVKGFYRVKLPQASDEDYLGSDFTDAFLGVSIDRQGKSSHFQAVTRLDILGRVSDQGTQWDYVTVGLGYGFNMRPNWTLSLEGWHRYRSTDSTSLASVGFFYHWNERLSTWFSIGQGFNDWWVPSLDSKLKKQISLNWTWRSRPKKLREWLNG